MKIKYVILILAMAALTLSACTRSASEAPTQIPGAEATQPGTDQQPPSNMETAVAGGGFATQTAQAAVTTPGAEQPVQGETPTSGENPPTGEEVTPVPEATATAPPATGAEPTTAPPVAPAEPTPAAGGSCTSPYTVQAGEWIWAIGRKCNISPQAIIEANNLACYYDLAGRLQCPLYAGDTLVLPANAPPFTGP
ncbi:MAG: hypothetical protein Fur0022_33780 [Anaerolineales bacterium]